MKRVLSSLLLIAYMASAINFTFAFHYCGGTYHSICFTSDTEADCCGSEEEDDGCCEDKVVSAKFKDNHTPAFKTSFSKIVFEPFFPATYFVVTGVLLKSALIDRIPHTGHSPPILREVPIYLLNRVLRL